MNLSELHAIPITRIKVRALVKCENKYVFIQRTRYGKTTPYLVFPGGKVKKSDQISLDKNNLAATLKAALVRELEEELAAKKIVIGELLGFSKIRKHYKEVLFFVEVGSIDWEQHTGKEFSNPNKGIYELVMVDELSKDVLGRRGLCLKPKEWRKLVCQLQHKL